MSDQPIDPSGEAGDAVASAVRDYGPDVLSNPGLLDNLFKDLLPDSPRNLRERAAVALRLGAPEVARVDLARVLELEPQAPDASMLKERLARLGVQKMRTLH